MFLTVLSVGFGNNNSSREQEEAKMGQVTSFENDQLPAELFFNILKHLSWEDRSKANFINKYYRQEVPVLLHQ